MPLGFEEHERKQDQRAELPMDEEQDKIDTKEVIGDLLFFNDEERKLDKRPMMFYLISTTLLIIGIVLFMISALLFIIGIDRIIYALVFIAGFVFEAVFIVSLYPYKIAVRQKQGDSEYLKSLKNAIIKNALRGRMSDAEMEHSFLSGLAQLTGADPSDIQKIAASQIEISNSNYRLVFQQAKESFRWALVAAGIGLVFFFAAISFLLLRRPENLSIISLISGSIIEVISGINFYLYGRTASQLSSFHVLLDRTTRFLIANSACEKMEEPTKKDEARRDIIRVFAANLPSTDSKFDSENSSLKKNAIKKNARRETSQNEG